MVSRFVQASRGGVADARVVHYVVRNVPPFSASRGVRSMIIPWQEPGAVLTLTLLMTRVGGVGVQRVMFFGG